MPRGGGSYPAVREDDGRKKKRIPGETPGLCQSLRRNGEPCTKFAIAGATVCKTHGGQLPGVKAAALRRLEKASLMAAGVMVEIAEDKRAYRKDRIEAAKQILDRAKIGTEKQVSVNVQGFENIVKSGKLLVDIEEEQ